MRISVVTPLYNKGPHIRATIESALAQTLAPHEVIVVDDGSSDGGLDTVRAMTDPRLKVLTRSPPGPGGYAARNLGIAEATGDWIAFLDADDIWAPGHLAALDAARRAAGEDVGCVFSRCLIREGGRDRAYAIDETSIRPGIALTLADFLRGWLATERCPMWTGAIAIRRDLFDRVGDFPAGRARRGGDKDMWLRAAAATRMAYAPQPTAEFHQDTVNRVTTSTAHVALPVIAETIRTLAADAPPEERRLLHRLLNQEVRLYAKHAAGAGSIVGPGFLHALALPQGLGDAARIVGYMAAGAGLNAVRRLRG